MTILRLTSIRILDLTPMLGLGELPHYIQGSSKFSVPVYTILGETGMPCCQCWTAIIAQRFPTGDLRVINKLRTGEYKVHNLHVVDEMTTHKIGKIRYVCVVDRVALGFIHVL